jgi:hypothetical protein
MLFQYIKLHMYALGNIYQHIYIFIYLSFLHVENIQILSSSFLKYTGYYHYL